LKLRINSAASLLLKFASIILVQTKRRAIFCILTSLLSSGLEASPEVEEVLLLVQMSALAPFTEHLRGVIQKILIKCLREHYAFELLQEFVFFQIDQPLSKYHPMKFISFR